MLQGVTVMSEGTKPDGQSLPFDDGALHTSCDAREKDALFLKHALCGEDALFSEIVGVVVGHTHEIVAGFLEQVTVTGGCTERVGVGSVALGASASVADGTLQVAYCQIRARQDVLGVTEQIPAVVGREHDTGESRPHHHIAGHGNSEFLGMYCQ